MLYREPKLLKVSVSHPGLRVRYVVSVLYREPKLLKVNDAKLHTLNIIVSVLYREPKLLKAARSLSTTTQTLMVSVLYREPKLLKARCCRNRRSWRCCFSALP